MTDEQAVAIVVWDRIRDVDRELDHLCDGWAYAEQLWDEALAKGDVKQAKRLKRLQDEIERITDSLGEIRGDLAEAGGDTLRRLAS